jgi:HEAT repeat protein
MNGRKLTLILGSLVLLAGGCSQALISPKMSDKELVDKSRLILAGFSHAQSPLYRSHAIEALADADQISSIQFVLEGLSDDYWGVRFTACMAIMEMRYDPARTKLVRLLADPDKSVQAAAAGTLHVLGEKKYTSKLGQLLFDKNPIVRRNTATVLGRMGDPGAIKILKTCLRDDDVSLRLQALEAMTLLGYGRASRLMITSCRSVYDDESVLAMLALGRIKCMEAYDQILNIYDKSASPERLGMRLVAARVLAMMDDNRGRLDAINALQYRSGDPKQSARIRNLAALALGDMKDKSSLGALEQTLTDPDPDVQIATATAILKIVKTNLPL